MGAFGAGKTTGLREFASKDNVNAEFVSFEQLVRQEERLENIEGRTHSRIAIIDNFDSINSLLGVQIEPPDLRAVAHLAAYQRVVLATRRSPYTGGDELIAQLRSEERLMKMGFTSPVIFHLLPWDSKELIEHASRTQNPELSHVADYIGTLPNEDTEYLRRPLVITMLLRLGPRLNSLQDRPTLAHVYHEYCNVALSTDYDIQRSQIPGLFKKEILSNLAYDIFSGASVERGTTSVDLSVPIERVSERVLETLMRAASFRQRSGVDGYGWTEEFLSTNHVFE